MSKPAATLQHDKGGRDLSEIKRAHELDLAVGDAKRLLMKHFVDVSNVQSGPAEDAETEEPYIEVSFDVRGEVADVRAAYDAFTDEWVKCHPFWIREQVRFAFGVI